MGGAVSGKQSIAIAAVQCPYGGESEYTRASPAYPYNGWDIDNLPAGTYSLYGATVSSPSINCKIGNENHVYQYINQDTNIQFNSNGGALRPTYNNKYYGGYVFNVRG